jgi:hypothetical protein
MEISTNMYDLCLINDLKEDKNKDTLKNKNKDTLKNKNKDKDNYFKKINVISSFFNVSNNAAKYMYHRRRQGFPYKKNNDFNFLPWTMKLQNALVKADTIPTWNWVKLSFHNLYETLQSFNIYVELQPTTFYKNKFKNLSEISNNKSELNLLKWTIVSSKISDKFLLKKIGFLPYTKK